MSLARTTASATRLPERWARRTSGTLRARAGTASRRTSRSPKSSAPDASCPGPKSELRSGRARGGSPTRSQQAPTRAPWTGRRDCVRRRLGRRFGRSGVGARRIVRLIRRVVRRRGARLDTALQRALRRCSLLDGNRLGSRSTLKVGNEKCQGQPGERHGDGGEHPPQPSRPRWTWFQSLHSKLIEAARCGDSGGAGVGGSSGRAWLGRVSAGSLSGAARRRAAATAAGLEVTAASGGAWIARVWAVRWRRGERRAAAKEARLGFGRAPSSGWARRALVSAGSLSKSRARTARSGSTSTSSGLTGSSRCRGRRHVRTRRHDTIIGFPDRSLHLRSHLFHQ